MSETAEERFAFARYASLLKDEQRDSFALYANRVEPETLTNFVRYQLQMIHRGFTPAAAPRRWN